jgi:hypothetical protein
MSDPPQGRAAREEVLNASKGAAGTAEAVVATEQSPVPTYKPKLSLPGGDR